MQQVFPDIYQWTSYGLTCMLEKMWNQALPNLHDQIPLEPYTIELVSSLERALNFGHTGNTQVLTSLMKPLFLSRAILDHGLPCLSGIVRTGNSLNDPVTIVNQDWPVHPKTHLPLMSSKRSHEINYGKSVMYVSTVARIVMIRYALPNIL
jgi:hypothetical protein